MKISRLFKLLLLTLPLIPGGGCATHALWNKTSLDAFNQPADDPHLRLFQTRLQNDLLVVYDEYSDRNDAIRTRAYLLNQNQKRLEQCQPPHFVSINRWRGLTPVAVLPGSNSPAAFFASVETNGQSFTIYSRNRPVHSYPLPVYNDGKARLARIVLTPVALTADLTIIGGYLFLYAWASGALNCVH